MNRSAKLWAGMVLGLCSAVGSLRADSLPPRQALYQHQLEFCRVGSPSDQEPVVSRIFPDTRLKDASGATYMESVDAKEFDRPFASSHLSADGKNGDTFTITLHRVLKPDQAKAEYAHTVYRDGETELKFSGVTLVPLCVAPPPLTATAIQERKSLQDFFEKLHYGTVIKLTFRDGRSTTARFHSFNPHNGIAWIKPMDHGWFNSRAVRLDDLTEAHSAP